ncbi:MAG TPA: hypothetical protein VES20_11260 [Bryobacteraceae bacterium]|nr:hypothetical protein [Bryobacteraceae bacterium]
MLKLIAIAVCTTFACMAAEEPWTKVEKLQSGQELRVTTTGAAKPLEARFAELTGDRVVVVEKDTQRAIPRDQIERIDARPAKAKARIKSETKVEQGQLGTGLTPGDRNTSRPAQNTSSGFSIEGKAGFENVYQRRSVRPAQ